MSVLYREAQAGDAEALAAFCASSFTATFGPLYPPEDLAAYVAESYGAAKTAADIADPAIRYKLALRAGAIAGYCMTGPLKLPIDAEASALELRRLYVDEALKGAGAAQALMDDALAWARARGAAAIYLSVWENNLRAQRFYRRYGFEDFGEWDFMVGCVADRDLIWRLGL